ncbi:MAG: tetratricopeptide repeat protein [Halomonas sp.]|uniref:tetratricopeptide repeat protein n=1 Tax=Halomonas sp. TaxID=1486246 RepID=UPI00179D7F5A|nr:tetratricopeptide repeat protein [Halomonas sp.]NWN83809.1 tetratricopeptide repeat protein [Halomonas sp.]
MARVPFSLLTPPLLVPVLALLVTGCQSWPLDKGPSPAMEDPLAGAPPIEKGLDAEGLADLLTAELAGQRGDYRRAAEGYLMATRRYRSAGLAERAALAASFGNDQELLDRAAREWQELAPDSVAPARLLAGLSVQRGDWDEALHQRLSLVREGGDSEISSLVEAALADDADPAPLLAELRDYLTTAPEDARRHDAELATAMLEVAVGDAAAAERRLERLGARAPELPALWLTRARLAQEADDPRAARAAARRGLTVSPGDPRFILLLAQSELRLGNVTAAEARTQALLEKHTGDAALPLGLARLYLDEGHHEPARRLLLPLTELPDPPPEAFLLLGDIARGEDEVDNALLYYRQVPPEEGFLLSRLRAAEMLVDNDRLSDARDFLHGERLRHAEQYGDLVTLEVELLNQEGLDQEADILLDRELARTPDNEQLLYLRGMRAWEAGDLQGMERDLGRIIERDPDNAMALNALGYTLADQGPASRLDEARELIERAHALEPDNPAILDSLGWVRYLQGDPQEALPRLERAYRDMPDQEVAAHLAEVLWSLGRHDEARDLVREAFRHLDEHPQLDELLQRTPELAPADTSH